MPAKRPAKPLADDELDELPPIDGADEAENDADYGDLIDDDKGGSGGDPFDDKTFEDDPVDASEIEADVAEAGWLNDAGEADDLDLGAAELSIFEGEADVSKDFDELGVGDEDFGLLYGEEGASLDAGEEGPLVDEEALREEDLPPLDADDEGDAEDVDVLDPGFAEDMDVKLPRAERGWDRVGAPLSLGPMRAVACASGGVFAASRGGSGSGLVRVDLEGACESLAATGLPSPSGIRALAASGGLVTVLTDDGGVFVSRDAGATFVEAAPWTSASGGASERDGASIATSRDEITVLTRAGTVVRTADAGASWIASTKGDARVASIAEDGAGGVAMALVDARGTLLAVARATEGVAPFPADLARTLRGGARVVARGACAAVAGAGAGLVRTTDGKIWTSIPGIAQVTAMTFLDERGTLLAAVYREADDVTWLVRVDEAGVATVVAELDAPPGERTERGKPASDEASEIDGAVHALARDDAHGVVWVAGDFGLVALEIREPGAAPAGDPAHDRGAAGKAMAS